MKKFIIGEKTVSDYRKTVYGIVEKDNKLLLVYSEKDNDYSLIGGGVEELESLEQALKREFLEESGYLIKNIQEFVNIDCFWTKKDGIKMETDANFFIIKLDETNIQKPIESFHKSIWIEKRKVLDLIYFPYQRKALEMYFENTDMFD